MANNLADITRNEAHRLIEETFREKKIEFQRRRDGLGYDIPNLGMCYEEVVDLANKVLMDIGFYAQEMPHRELLPEFTPEYLLILKID